ERADLCRENLQLRRHEQGDAVEAAARPAGKGQVPAGTARPPDQARSGNDGGASSRVGRALEQGGRRKLMSKPDGRVEVFHLGWRENGDGLDVALAVNRLLSAGACAWRVAARQSPAEAGDYLLELIPGQKSALAALGVS